MAGRRATGLFLAAAIGASGAVALERVYVAGDAATRGAADAAPDGIRRPCAGRLAGRPFGAYPGPVRPRMRGQASPAPPAPVPLARSADVLASSVERPSADTLRDLGVLRLEQGRYALATGAFERARALAPDDARIAADLAAALLEEAIVEDAPMLAARALSVADEAIAADSMRDEAWFTRAAALEQLWIGPEAIRAWYAYLGRDQASPWAVEARRRVCALERIADPAERVTARRHFEAAIGTGDEPAANAVVLEHPHEARRAGLDRIVQDWPAAVLDGRESERTRLESELHAAGGALAAGQQDRFVADAAESVAAPEIDGDRRRLAEALTAYGNGREAFRRGEVQAAASLFGDARARLAAAGCRSMATLADFDLARCEIYGREYDTVLNRLASIGPEAERRGYRHLAARVRWVAGYVHAVRFEVAPALGQLRRALDELDSAGDVEASAIVGVLLAETTHWYGLRDESWAYGRRALAALSRMGASGQASTGFSGVALIVAEDGETAASGCLLDAAASAAQASGDATGTAGALAVRAVMHARLGDPAASAADLSAARDVLGRIADPVVAERVRAEVELADGEVSAAAAPDRAADLLSRVLATYAETADRVRTVPCLRLRAAAHVARSDAEAARRDLDAALGELDEQRRRLRHAELRAMLGSEVRNVFAAAIGLHLDRLGDPDAAFRLAERERTWARRDVPSGEPPVPDGVSPAVPEGVTVLAYTTRDDSTNVWVIDRTGAAVVRTEVGAARLTEHIDRFRRGLEHGEPSELADLSEPIVEALWRPVAERIPEDATVAIVGDASIRSIPFGALVDSRTGRFLVERNAFEVARSVADLVRRRESAGGSDRPALVVGDPGFDPGSVAGLVRLPDAADEARSIASMYADSRLLVAADATVPAFRAGVRDVAVIHYAGHALDDVGGRGDSALVLAGGSLASSEIAEMRLDGVRLAVLAACGTSAGDAAIGRSIGSASLADAFLDAGVRQVVASHWAVRDDATAALLVEFHRRLRGGATAAAALRAAVLAVIGGPGGGGVSPRDWAAFGILS